MSVRRISDLLNRTDGVSLLELMVVATFMLVVIFATYSLLDSGLRVERDINNAVGSEQIARTAVDRIGRDLRNTKNFTQDDQTTTTLSVVLVSNETNVSHIITYRLHTDDPSNQWLERIDKRRVGGIVTSTTSEILGEHIVNDPTNEPMFTFYDAYGNVVSGENVPASARRVRVWVVALKNPTAGRGEFSLKTEFALRN